MLPFLKNKEDSGMAGPVEVEVRAHDDTFDMLDAVVDDLLMAFEHKDKALLKSALQSFAEHLKDMDEQQDKELMK